MKKKKVNSGDCLDTKRTGKYLALQRRYKESLEENKLLKQRGKELQILLFCLNRISNVDPHLEYLRKNILSDINGIQNGENKHTKTALESDVSELNLSRRQILEARELVLELDPGTLRHEHNDTQSSKDIIEDLDATADYLAFEYKGYQCCIRKRYLFDKDEMQFFSSKIGFPPVSYCGYVAVAEGHPFYQMDYFDIPVEVHGGLTFGQTIIPGAGILSDLVDEFVIGFDCGHLGDTIEECNAEYVRKELESLVDQLIKAAEK